MADKRTHRVQSRRMDIDEDSSLQQFLQKIDEAQARITKLSYEEGDRNSQEILPRQLLEDLNVVMKEIQMAAEEILAQNKKLALAGDKLEKERRRYRDLFHFAPDGYLVTDEQGTILEANQAVGDILGVEPLFLFHKPLVQYIAWEDRNGFGQRFAQLRQSIDVTGSRIDNWEFTILPHSGNTVVVSASITAIHGSQDSLVGGLLYRWLIRDIQAKKRFEREMQEMKNELLKSRERERQKMARSLHDGPMQDLHGVIFQLKPLENEINHPRLRNNIDIIETQLIDVVRKLRFICSDLRPPTLVPFGLEKAIRSHAGTFRETHPEIEVTLELGADVPAMAEEERLVFFQIYQQAMVNVFRHADARHVWVRLRIKDRKVCLEVEDNGRGFVLPKKWIELVRHHHYGLADSAERAESIGGKIEVDSMPGQGTKVRLLLPIEQTEATG